MRLGQLGENSCHNLSLFDAGVKPHTLDRPYYRRVSHVINRPIDLQFAHCSPFAGHCSRSMNRHLLLLLLFSEFKFNQHSFILLFISFQSHRAKLMRQWKPYTQTTGTSHLGKGTDTQTKCKETTSQKRGFSTKQKLLKK